MGFSVIVERKYPGGRRIMFFTEGAVNSCILGRSTYVVCRYGIVVDKSTTIRSATIWNNGMDAKNRHEWGCPDLNRGQ